MRLCRSARSLAVLAVVLIASGCVVTPTPDPTTATAPATALEPPEIEFAGLVTDVRTYADHIEYTDATGEVHAADAAAYRDVTSNGWSGPLLVLGRDAEGPFVASFPTQDGLPPDCYRENAAGIDRGSHIEINGVLWRKAPAFDRAVSFGAGYPAGVRFCFDDLGRVATVIGR